MRAVYLHVYMGDSCDRIPYPAFLQWFWLFVQHGVISLDLTDQSLCQLCLADRWGVGGAPCCLSRSSTFWICLCVVIWSLSWQEKQIVFHHIQQEDASHAVCMCKESLGFANLIHYIRKKPKLRGVGAHCEVKKNDWKIQYVILSWFWQIVKDWLNADTVEN